MPDHIPAVVPRSKRSTEARWLTVLRQRIIVNDLFAGLVGAAVGLVMHLNASGEFLMSGIWSLLLPGAWLGSVGALRGYSDRNLEFGSRRFGSILRSGLSIFGLAGIASFAGELFLPRWPVIVALASTIGLSLVLQYRTSRQLARGRYRGRNMRRVLVVGRDRQAETLRQHLENRPADGYLVVAVCRPGGEALPGAAASERMDEPDILAAVDLYSVDVVAIAADPDLSGELLRRLSWALEQRGVELIVSPGITEVSGSRISVRPVDGLLLLHVERPSVSAGPYLIKGTFDRVIGFLLLLGLSPLLLVIAVMVKLTSSGPVLFRQPRVGRNGEQFKMLKFRTMVLDPDRRLIDLAPVSDGSGVLFKLRDDPRVTRVGKSLRRYSLDDLPQLLNVLRGEMSLVGPRPALPTEVTHYTSNDARRLLVKPGLTGLWQVSGRYDLSWDESVLLDLRYVDNWSLQLDLLILLKTFRAVFSGTGAY
ncbi:sugar transferase [Kribbella sp. ALI-6-A]|uniref:sugar transferase n=1 Tax=Kribbella sp. ALI-6-A TaxID=1933817 RepID=UPI001EDBDE24|nr:sugar transferase [Kribbella sp. ALI-6-A]